MRERLILLGEWARSILLGDGLCKVVVWGGDRDKELGRDKAYTRLRFASRYGLCMNVYKRGRGK